MVRGSLGMTEFDIDEWLNENEALLKSMAAHAQKTVYGLSFGELLQEFRIACWKAAGNFDSSRGVQFSTYATRIMMNKELELKRSDCSNKRQEDKKSVSLDAPAGEGAPLGDILVCETCESPEAAAESAEVMEFIEAHISGMDAQAQRIVRMSIEGYTQTYVAGKLGISQPDVSQQLKRFRQGLKKALQASGYLQG